MVASSKTLITHTLGNVNSNFTNYHYCKFKISGSENPQKLELGKIWNNHCIFKDFFGIHDLGISQHHF